MNKINALKELGAVIRQSPVPLSKIESGPAPLTPRAQLLNATAAASTGSTGSSLLSSLLSGLTGGGSSSSLGSTLLGSVLGSGSSGPAGLGLSPLISSLAGLFGGGGTSAPAALNLYSAPPRVNLQAGLSNGSITAADHGQSGAPRSSQPQITLQVQAMDSKSIMDRSSDIAQAVRQAMLQSHPINDVVADL